MCFIVISEVSDLAVGSKIVLRESLQKTEALVAAILSILSLLSTAVTAGAGSQSQIR